jgi:hypothetical protein
MWEKIKQKMIQVNKTNGVQVHFMDHNSVYFSSASLSVQKGQLAKENITHACTSIADLKVNKKSPLALAFTGKGVLIKKITGPANDNALATTFPQINPAEFYSQIIKCKDSVAIAIIRKEIADKVIKEFHENGFQIAEISLGFQVIETILPFFPNISLLVAEPYQLNIKDGVILDFETIKQPVEPIEYVLSSQYIQSTHLLGYAAAAKLIAGSLRDLPDLPHDTIIQNREQLLFQKYFNTSALSLGSLIFFLLLINFLLYSHYFNKNNQLEMAQNVSKNTSVKTDSLVKYIINKEAFITESGWAKQQKTSFFADRFAGLLPSETWLKSVEFNPIKKSFMTEENSIHFKTDTILITGTCTEAGQINTFINNIKTLNEVKNVALKNYSYKKIDNEGSFSLEVITQ